MKVFQTVFQACISLSRGCLPILVVSSWRPGRPNGIRRHTSLVRFVQDNYSCSTRGVLRGLHYQLRHPQGKLVYVLQGEVFDVVVDISRGSPTFGRWVGEILSGDNHRQLYIPPGFAHGFCVLST